MSKLWSDGTYSVKAGTDRYGKPCFVVCFQDGADAGKYFYSREKAISRAQKWSARGDGPRPSTQTKLSTGADTIIGLLSDTHDQMELVEGALEVFHESACQAVVHCGDFANATTLDRITARLEGVPFHWVAGNHDSWAAESGLPGDRLSAPWEEHGEVVIAGNLVGVAHGTYGHDGVCSQEQLREWIEARRHGYLFHGHFHQFNLKFPTPDNSTVVIDPGGFYRRETTRLKTPRTVTTINLTRREVGLFVWNEADDGFESVGTIGLAERTFHAHRGFDTWRYEARKWGEKSGARGQNWASASEHIYGNAAAWISHQNLWDGDERL